MQIAQPSSDPLTPINLLSAYTVLVWIRLALAPWWIQWLAYSALIFTTAGIPVAIVNPHEPGQWLGWWIGIAIVALVVGLVCSLAARSRAPQLRQMIDGPVRHQISRSAPGGRIVDIWLDPGIPADPREIETQEISVRLDRGTFAETGLVFASEIITDVTGATAQ
ncbi:Uncharacterised protein [Mycobacteroides abscessus]|nr:Uncharacterised protein [Mycobacteroides abscessus]